MSSPCVCLVAVFDGVPVVGRGINVTRRTELFEDVRTGVYVLQAELVEEFRELRYEIVLVLDELIIIARELVSMRGQITE